MTERILLDLGTPVAEALNLPRRVPVRRSALGALRNPDGLDLTVLRRELAAAADDDPSTARSLGHGIAVLDLLLEEPNTGADTLSPAPVAAAPAQGARRRSQAVLLVVLLLVVAGAGYLWTRQGDDTTTAGETPAVTSAPITALPTTALPTTAPPTTALPTTTAGTTTTTTVPTLEVPLVVGERRGATIATLEALGLVVEVERVDSYDVDAGEVLSVDPPEGTELVAGDTVTLTVARRPDECNDRPATIPATSFTDVAGLGDEAADAIGWAVAVGLVADGATFGPDEAMSRAAAITVLHRYMCEPLAQGIPPSFTDVADGAFYSDAVAWAAAGGTVTGTSPTIFSPEDPITRAAFVTVVWRAFGEPGSDAELPFTDVPVGAFYEPALRWAFGEGLINGTTATTFAPDDTLSRVTTIVLFGRIELGPNPLVG